MDQAAGTISEVVIVLSRPTSSPKVLKAIGEAHGLPASKVNLIDASSRVSEAMKPLLAGRTKTDVASILFIATEDAPPAYLKQFDTFSSKIGSSVMTGFADVDLTAMEAEDIQEWSRTGEYVEQSEEDLIDDLLFDDDSGDDDEEEARSQEKAPAVPDPVPEPDPVLDSLPESAPETTSAGDPRPASGVAPIHIPESSDGDVDLSSFQDDDDDPIDMEGLGLPQQSAPAQVSPSPEPEPILQDSPVAPEPQQVEQDDEDDLMDLPTMVSPTRPRQSAPAPAPEPPSSPQPEREWRESTATPAPGVPLPPNLSPQNSALMGQSQPSQPRPVEHPLDNDPTPPSAPRPVHQPQQNYAAPSPVAPVQEPSGSLEDDVFGPLSPVSTTPDHAPSAPEPPTDQIPRTAAGSPLVSGPEGRNYREFLPPGDRRVQERTRDMNSAFPSVDMPKPEEAKEHARQHYGSPRRSQATASASSPRNGEARTGNVFYISGSHGGAGKTTCSWVFSNAAALAMQQAHSERPVYLIEVDYRNPKLVSRMGEAAQRSNLGHFADELEVILRRGGANQHREMVSALIKNTIQQPDTGLFVLPAAHSYEDLDRWNPEKLRMAISSAVNIASRISSHVFLDAGTLTARHFEPLDEQLLNLSSTAVMVTDASNYEEARRAIKILRDPGTKRISRESSFVNVFMNRTPSHMLEEAASEMHPYPISGVWPLLDDLSPSSDSRGWVNSAPGEVKRQLLYGAGHALTRMGYTEFNAAYGNAILNPEPPKRSWFRRLLAR